jgi:dTDP-4-amino-4,6-dideoxygalactose transaminase
MSGPFLELAAAYEELQAELDAAAKRVITSGHYILGPEVSFESEFAHYCSTHCAADRALRRGLERSGVWERVA